MELTFEDFITSKDESAFFVYGNKPIDGNKYYFHKHGTIYAEYFAHNVSAMIKIADDLTVEQMEEFFHTLLVLDGKAKPLASSLKKAISEQIAEEKVRLYEDDKYSQGYDCDSVNNGEGEMLVRKEKIYDDDKIQEDAVNHVADEFFNNCANCGRDTKTAEFTNAIEDFIRSF